MNTTTIEKRKTFYESGKLFSIAPYINGVKDGVEKWFYENGKLRCKLFYKNGNYIGSSWYEE